MNNIQVVEYWDKKESYSYWRYDRVLMADWNGASWIKKDEGIFFKEPLTGYDYMMNGLILSVPPQFDINTESYTLPILANRNVSPDPDIIIETQGTGLKWVEEQINFRNLGGNQLEIDNSLSFSGLQPTVLYNQVECFFDYRDPIVLKIRNDSNNTNPLYVDVLMIGRNMRHKNLI